MDIFISIIQIVLPAGLALYGVYLMIRSFINRDLEKAKLEIRNKSIETVLPNRLQAYERVVLFLERISPQNLLVRINNGEYTSGEFHQILLSEIRNEYNHNVSQQIYMSNEAWELLKSAKEDLIMTINEASSAMSDKNNSLDLSKAIMDRFLSKEVDPIGNAIYEIKKEISRVF